MKLTDKQIEAVIELLQDKIARIENGQYGEEDRIGDDIEWIADLKSTVLKLQARKFGDLQQIHLEEIDCCGLEGSNVAIEIKRLATLEADE